MTKFYQLNKIAVLFLILGVYSCGGNENSEQDEPSPQEVDTTAEKEVEFIENAVLFETIFNTAGNLESRQKMIEVLGWIGVHDHLGETTSFLNVEQIKDGYIQACEYDYNGSLNFLISGEEELNEYYGFYEPVMEHSSQDLFLYNIEEVFISPTDKKLVLELRYIEHDNGDYYTDMASSTMSLEIWEDGSYGTLIKFGNRFYMNESFFDSLPEQECADYEP